MNVSIFLYKGDVAGFFRKNVTKLIVCGILVAIAVVFATGNALAVESVSDYFEGRNAPLYAFLRGDGSLLMLALASLAELVCVAVLVLACCYNDLTSCLGFCVLPYIAYSHVFDALAALRYFAVNALVFVVLYLALTVLLLLWTAYYVCFAVGSKLRYRYGLKEMRCLVGECVPIYIGFAVIFLLKLVFVSVGCIFI